MTFYIDYIAEDAPGHGFTTRHFCVCASGGRVVARFESHLEAMVYWSHLEGRHALCGEGCR